MKLVIFGLTITSSWGNGHATTYRGLVRELERRGHQVTFFEREAPWYASNRDLPEPPYCRTILYDSIDACFATYAYEIAGADWVILGSYVADGVEAAERITGSGGCRSPSTTSTHR